MVKCMELHSGQVPLAASGAPSDVLSAPVKMLGYRIPDSSFQHNFTHLCK